MPQWYTTAVDSDIVPSGNVLLSKELNLAGETPSNLSLVIPGSSTRAAQFHSPVGVPNNADWQDGTAVPKVKIVTGFANVQVAVNIVREDAAGGNVEQQTLSPEQLAVSGTVLTFNDFVGITWGTPAGAVTERLRYRIQGRTTTGTGRTLVFEVGAADTGIDMPLLWLGTLIGRALVSLMGRGVLAGAGGLVGRSLVSLAGRAGAPAGAGSLRGRALVPLAARGQLTGAAPIQGRALLSLAGRAAAGATGELAGRAMLGLAGRGGPPAGGGALAGRGLVGASGRATPTGAGALAGRALLQLLPRGVLADLQAAVGGCVETILAAVRSRYATLVEGVHSVPTLHDNEGEAMPDSSAWVRFSLELDRSFQMDFGGAEQSRRLLGQATAAIYLPFGVGDGEAWELADIINDAFRGQAADGVIYSPPPYPIRRGLVDDRWVLEVVVPFYAQCAEPVA